MFLIIDKKNNLSVFPTYCNDFFSIKNGKFSKTLFNHIMYILEKNVFTKEKIEFLRKKEDERTENAAQSVISSIYCHMLKNNKEEDIKNINELIRSQEKLIFDDSLNGLYYFEVRQILEKLQYFIKSGFLYNKEDINPLNEFHNITVYSRTKNYYNNNEKFKIKKYVIREYFNNSSYKNNNLHSVFYFLIYLFYNYKNNNNEIFEDYLKNLDIYKMDLINEKVSITNKIEIFELFRHMDDLNILDKETLKFLFLLDDNYDFVHYFSMKKVISCVSYFLSDIKQILEKNETPAIVTFKNKSKFKTISEILTNFKKNDKKIIKRYHHNKYIQNESILVNFKKMDKEDIMMFFKLYTDYEDLIVTCIDRQIFQNVLNFLAIFGEMCSKNKIVKHEVKE